MADQPTPKRGLNLLLLTLYGLGTTIGAGIYVLVGKVAGNAGMFAPLAFLLSAVLVGFSAVSFAELSARFPKSAGEALYVYEGFGLRRLALAIGLMVVAAGLISSSTITLGFVGYFRQFVPVPPWLIVMVVVGTMVAIAAWGIVESATIAGVVTVVEILGLVYIIANGTDHLIAAPAHFADMFVPPGDATIWIGILAGVVVAFYAFIGFEDMVNVAEEVKTVETTLPAAIFLTLGVTTVLYVLIGIVGVLAVPIDTLSGAEAPLALIADATGASGTTVSAVAIVAVLNGALVQIIMASRVLYGLGNRGWLPPVLAVIHPARRTPVNATLIVGGLVLIFALALPIETLARLTSLITLAIFATVNLALWRLKGRDHASRRGVVFSRWIPAVGFLVSAGVLVFEGLRLVTAGTG